MLRHQIYYGLKPFVPRPLRMAVRRWFAKRKRERVGDIWPILPGSERRPEGWTGWPDGKRFAFVLTHDVESQRGLDRVKQLAELEMSLGFRSCFNFIPEGPYSVPSELRSWLTERGFEVGVHDLHHDGKLYASREGFRGKAARISRYLKEWNAAGFRSAYMLNKLDWLHDLEVQYDASTFDTDPFEPQPKGVGTIFPFWVPAPTDDRGQNSATISASQHFSISAFHQPGYVELPYTLPQDSTIFMLLDERDIDIWMRKVEWIARHGGMALANVHPDYIQFPDDNECMHAYPVELYRKLLCHVSVKHGETFWHSLPCNVAALVLSRIDQARASRSGSHAPTTLLTAS